MKRVLIVDDTAFMRLSIRTMLEKNGFEVAGEAENGEASIKKFEELSPDLVTMDITMPKMNGIEAVKAIRHCNPDAKVLMITAMGQEGMVREAILAGAKGFLVKPFREQDIITAMNKII